MTKSETREIANVITYGRELGADYKQQGADGRVL